MMTQPMRWIGAALLLLGSSACAFNAPTDPSGASASNAPSRLDAFNYAGVTLDGGRLKAQYDEVLQDYLAIPNDNLLKSFRKRAGRPAPGDDMGGWYEDGLFNIFGQILSGLARFHAGSGNLACKVKADTLIHEWALCIDDDGFFFNNPESKSAHYVYEKLVGGLVDNYVYCDNEEARECLSRITDWAMAKLPRNHHGWCAEWYTLSENLYRAYLATGEERYREFAKVWEYPEYWDHFANRTDIFSKYPFWFGENPAYHAYSHVNTLSGAAAAYEVTGEGYYRNVIANAYDYLLTTQTLVTGGYGPSERLETRNGLVASLYNPFEYKHFETQCGSWAAFKLSKYLIRLTGQGRYGDWIEQLVCNGIGASVSMDCGRVQYCSDYHVGGGWKQNINDPWSCCAGTRSMAIADYLDLIYFHSDDALYVNLFTPSTVRWSREGATVTLTQNTEFPEGSATELTISLDKPQTFGLRIRVPGWVAADPEATLNGRPVELDTTRNGWTGLRRRWRNGDTLRIEMPMALRVSHADPAKPYPAALLYGPVALAVAGGDANPGDRIDLASIDQSLLPIPDRPLHFRTTADPQLEVKPFYAFKKDERYFLYLDPSWADRFSVHLFTYRGAWLWGGTRELGAWAEAKFEGPALRWEFTRGPNGGTVQILIDGNVIDTVDQYHATPSTDSRDWTGLAPGRHTIRFTMLAARNPAAVDPAINIGALRFPQ